MSKKIFEETGGPRRGHAAGATDVEKQASQLASDTRYKVKQSMGKGTKLNPAQVSKAYLAQLAKSPAPPAVKALAKKKLIGEEYTEDIKKLVESSLVNALVQVFSEESHEKVWIVVTDKKTGNTYRRRATREKIAELRANPNVSRVEITSYHPDEDDDKKGEKTARVKAGKGLKNDGNLANNYPPYDKVTRGDVIAGATGKDQMGGKKKVKEEFIGEVKQKSDSENKKITGEKVNNYNGKDAVIKVFPSLEEQMKDEVSAQQKTQKPQQNQSAINQVLMAKQRADMAQRDLAMKQKSASQKGVNLTALSASYEPEGDSIDEKITAKTEMGSAIKDFYASKSSQLAGRTKEERRKAAIAAVLTARRGGKKLGEECDCEDEKEPKMKKTEDGVEDPRSIPTKISLAKNKLRSMGLRMSYEPEGESIDELNRFEKETGTSSGSLNMPKGRPTQKGGDTNLALRSVRQTMRKMSGKPQGQQKKVPGKKPPTAGQYGAPESPAQKVAKRRAAAQRAQDNMSSRFD